MTPKLLTPEEQFDADRLKKLWGERKDELHLNQMKAAKILGYNSQGAISQYLNGKIAMNMETVAKFAKLLRVEIQDISPRYSKMAGKPLPPDLDGYVSPTIGELGGVKTNTCLPWFAWQKEFCDELDVRPNNLKLVRLSDDSFKEYPFGSLFLVDDSVKQKAENGIYFLQMGDKIVARRIILKDEMVISDGVKEQTIGEETFALLRILGKAISVFSPIK